MIYERLLWNSYNAMLKMKSLLLSENKNIIRNEIEISDNAVGKYIWVFCTTIGELNACYRFLDKYTGKYNLVIITDKEIYKEAFNAKFSSALVITLIEFNNNKKNLIKKFKPDQLIICEIPSSLHEAPCRFEYSLVRDVHYLGGSVIVINGWLYNESASCRQDYIEQFLFNKYFYKFIDAYFVQSDSVKKSLLEKGVRSNKILVSNNFKFDSLYDKPVVYETLNSKKVIKEEGCKLFLAGSLSGIDEFLLVIQSFKLILDVNVKLLIAPRHPEFKENIHSIERILKEEKLTFSLLSGDNVSHNRVIVVDTFGDLQSLINKVDTVYIGKNHNILEPISMKKPVATSSGWSKKYSTYNILQFCYDNKLVTLCDNSSDLADFIVKDYEKVVLPSRKGSSVDYVLNKLISHELSLTEKY